MNALIAHTQDELDAHAQRVVHCSSCRAKIVWFKTALGKNMPVNADTVLPIDTRLDLRHHISHFATCPNSTKHRKPKA